MGAALSSRAVTNADLRARIRQLMAAGDLPDERPTVVNTGDGFDRFKRGAPCLICGESNALVAYFWPGGRVAHLHAACDAASKQERALL